jgi:hypothetical protein
MSCCLPRKIEQARREGRGIYPPTRRQRRDDSRLRLLFRHLVGGAAKRDRCDGTNGCTLQQTLQRFSLKD